MDLASFDLFRVFGIINDESVTRIAGKSGQQFAFRIGKQTQLKSKIEDVFPHGVPHEFSFGMLYRPVGYTNEAWTIIQITDEKGHEYLSIVMNQVSKNIELNVLNDKNEMENYKFQLPKVRKRYKFD